MANEALAQAMEKAISETIEEMFFEETAPKESGSLVFQEFSWVKIEVKEPLHNNVYLGLKKDFVSEVIHTALMGDAHHHNMLAEGDAERELLNIIVGAFMRHSVDSSQAFSLGLPHMDAPPNKEAMDTIICYQVGEWDMLVCLQSQQENAA